MQFIVKEKPSFDKENLLKLYNILSFNCLDDEDKLKEGAYYRDEGVLVGGFEGAPDSMIEECMDSLFAFVNNSENVKKYGALLPHICHYIWYIFILISIITEERQEWFLFGSIIYLILTTRLYL